MADFTPIATMVKPPSADFSQINSMVQMGRNATALQREQELLPYDIEAGKAQSEKTQADANTAKLENMYKQVANSSRNLLKLLNQKDPVTDKVLEDHLVETLTNSGASKQAIQQALQNVPRGGTDRENRAFIARKATEALTAESQLEKLFPNANATNVGGAVVPMAGGGPLAYTPPGTQVGPATATTISPQVATNQITGAPMIIGGGRAPGSQPVNQGPSFGGQGTNLPAQAAPAAVPNQNPISSMTNPAQVGGQVNPAANVQAPAAKPQAPQNQLVQGANESPANFNARVAQTQGAYAKAQDQFTNPNSEFGHIPTIQNINKNVMTLLKDPSVDTGAVQNFLAGKTGKGNLSAKEQELAKFLEQRIQNLSIKSDKDAESKKAAFGTIGMKKEALMEVVRNDNAWVTQQDLQSKGILNNGGNSINPNYGKVSAFNNQFAQMAQNPNLMKYISLVGENPSKIAIDKDDHDAARKYFGKLSNEEKSKLELERQTLLKLVGGQ